MTLIEMAVPRFMRDANSAGASVSVAEAAVETLAIVIPPGTMNKSAADIAPIVDTVNVAVDKSPGGYTSGNGH